MARTLLGLVGAALAVAGAWVLGRQCYWWLRLGDWPAEGVLMGLVRAGAIRHEVPWCEGWMGACKALEAIPFSWALWAGSYLALKARSLATAVTPARKA